MTSFVGIFLSRLLPFLCYVAGQYSLNMRLPNVTVHEKEQIVITCEVTSTQINTNLTMAWMKRPFSAVSGAQEEIAKNKILSTAYSKTNRYQVDEEIFEEFTKHRFNLTIKNLKSSDSGEIGCQIPSHNIELFKSLIVHAKTETISMSSKDLDNTHAVKYTDRQEVQVKEDETRKFFCNVHRAYPEPRVRMLLGSKDITGMFQKKEDLKRNGPPTDQELFYDIQLTNNDLVFTYDFKGKELTCIADDPKRPDSNKTVNTSITINMPTYRPKFDCASQFEVKLYQKEVEIRCNVSAEPEVETVRFQWESNRENKSISDGENDGIYHGNIRDTKGDKLSKEMILRIERIYPQHFRTYYFQAGNMEGKTIKRIVLKRDLQDNSTNSASKTIIWSSMILSMAQLYFGVLSAAGRWRN